MLKLKKMEADLNGIVDELGRDWDSYDWKGVCDSGVCNSTDKRKAFMDFVGLSCSQYMTVICDKSILSMLQYLHPDIVNESNPISLDIDVSLI